MALTGMELKHSIELIHLSAQHASREIRKKVIAEYLSCHPEIDKNEVTAMMAEADID
jgi:5-formyltetrahydrofolate cyclo-ligase